MYLTGLCQRRHWPDPLFQTYRTRLGYGCTVRVNNREYSTDVEYETDELAKNAAATRAYMICRNFSVNDGMYPGQRPGQGGVVQGLPVAIGTGRRGTVSSNEFDSSSSSGGDSPRNSDYGLDQSRRSSKSSTSSISNCLCGRGTVLGTKLSALAYNDCAFVDPVYGCYWRRPIHRPGVPGVTVTMPDDDVWGDANTYKDTYVPGHDNAVLFQPTFEGSTGYEHPAGKWVDDNDHRQPKYKPGDKRQVALPPAGPPYLPFDAQAAACEECNKPVNFIHVITHECLEGDALRCVIKAARDDVPLELDDYVRAGDLLAYFQAGVQQVPPGSGQTQPEGEGPALAPGLEFPPGLELPPGFGLPPQVPGAGPDPSTVYTTHYNTEKPCPWCEVTTRTFVSPIAAPTSDTDVITITATPDSGPPFTTTIALPPAEPTPDFPQILPPPPPQPLAENPTVITITATPAGGATTITTTYTLPPVETPAIPPVIPQPAPPRT
ncbi:hypothetical protein GRF29_44g2516960 [Pseudopithomyces chartarum]|uniref:Uncharacterized protein n=1 Tax=Pseudopithomyces chartarum TaxID=1892770 RepID=A0AAN6M349_9PLEO|nr:hypothetical protein GRF29_44g2516960 [Pseudopithomyces chartarum]